MRPTKPAEHADGRAREDRRADVEVLAARRAAAWRSRLLAQQVDAEVHEHRPDRDEQGGIRQQAGQVAARHRAQHRRRRHPGEQPPVDAPGAHVHDRGGERRDAGDADVGAGSRGGMGRRQQHGGEADVPEHKAYDATREGDGEAPGAERDQLERVHEARKSPRRRVRIVLSTMKACVAPSLPYSSCLPSSRSPAATTRRPAAA